MHSFPSFLALQFLSQCAVFLLKRSGTLKRVGIYVKKVSFTRGGKS